MKCPYCGAEVRGRFCEYCDSEVIVPDVLNTSGGRDVPAKQKIVDMCDKYMQREDMALFDFGSLVKGPDGIRKEKGHKISKNLFKMLEIPDSDSVYLIHDDTLMSTGKNGFAVTSSGFYTKVIFEDRSFVSWQQFMQAEKIECNSSEVTADGVAVAYQSGTQGSREKLAEFYRQMQEMVRTYGLEVVD